MSVWTLLLDHFFVCLYTLDHSAQWASPAIHSHSHINLIHSKQSIVGIFLCFSQFLEQKSTILYLLNLNIVHRLRSCCLAVHFASTMHWLWLSATKRAEENWIFCSFVPWNNNYYTQIVCELDVCVCVATRCHIIASTDSLCASIDKCHLNKYSFWFLFQFYCCTFSLRHVMTKSINVQVHSIYGWDGKTENQTDTTNKRTNGIQLVKSDTIKLSVFQKSIAIWFTWYVLRAYI